MSRNPFINAFAATAYIALVATVMFNGEKIFGPDESVIIPIAVLSLFVLSAAVMGYLFVLEPLRLFLEGDHRGATKLFLATVGVFACVTGAIFLVAFFFNTSF